MTKPAVTLDPARLNIALVRHGELRVSLKLASGQWVDITDALDEDGYDAAAEYADECETDAVRAQDYEDRRSA